MVSKTKCTIKNESFFSELNYKSAYALGLMYSDGWVSKNNVVSISQAVHNSQILDFFYEELGFEGFYYLNVRNTPEGIKYYPCLGFNSKKMCNDLKKYGIIPGKTDTIKVPAIPKELIPCFLLGVFDGDGCIHYSGKNTCFLITGTKDSIISITEMFADLGIVTKYRHDKTKTYSLYCYKKSEIKKIYDLFYKTELGLKRKKDIFEQILNDYDLIESSETRFENDFLSSKHEFNSYLIGSILGCSNFLSETRIKLNKGLNDTLEFKNEMIKSYIKPSTKNVVKGTLYSYTYKSSKLFKYLYSKTNTSLDQSIVNRINNISLGIFLIDKAVVNDTITVKDLKYNLHDNEKILGWLKRRYKIVGSMTDKFEMFFNEENTLKIKEFCKDVFIAFSNYKTNG